VKISIITVVWNNLATIGEAIDSVLSQTYDDIEYIVIDGGSTDGTIEKVLSYGKKIDKFVSEEDDGLYHAMNKGIALATGDIIGFLHSDDIFADTEVLSTIATKFNNNLALDACYGDMIYSSRFNTSNIMRYWKSNTFEPGSFSKGWSPPHLAFFVKLKIYKKYGGFDTKYKISSDIELMMRFLEIHRINSEYFPQIFIKMRNGGTSTLLKNKVKQNKEVLVALESHNLPKNIITFFSYKFISRLKQFIQRPKN
tara:strand:+ start:797 stop:1558 length:762 start_codon:yes stop_codon:yes gene_type:complete